MICPFHSLCCCQWCSLLAPEHLCHTGLELQKAPQRCIFSPPLKTRTGYSRFSNVSHLSYRLPSPPACCLSGCCSGAFQRYRSVIQVEGSTLRNIIYSNKKKYINPPTSHDKFGNMIREYLRIFQHLFDNNQSTSSNKESFARLRIF